LTPRFHETSHAGTARARRAVRIGAACAVLLIGAACATAPQKDTVAPAPAQANSSARLESAFQAYDLRKFESAAAAFEAIANDGAASANDRRIAHLGMAMIHLSTDLDWRDIDAAKVSLDEARAVAQEDPSPRVETNMLALAVNDLVNVEADNTELMRRSNELARELGRVKETQGDWQAEREALLAEQARLQQTLDKLKQLTLGN
jgi:hypothetical protein